MLPHTRVVAVVAILAGIATGQQTLIVDPVAGPFQTISSAVVAAAPGDIVLVRAGIYSESKAIKIDKGIHLIGRGARLEPSFSLSPPGFLGIEVHDVPSGQTFAMRGFDAYTASYTAGPSYPLTVRDCAGSVSLRDLGQSNLAQWDLRVSASAQVHVADAVVETLSIGSASVVVERCVFDPNLFSGLTVASGDVSCVSCSIRGSFGTFPGAGLTLMGGRVTLTRTTVQGTGTVFPQPAIRTSGGVLILDPSATVTPAPGAVPIEGPATVIHREVSSTIADTTGQRLDVELHGPAGADFAILISDPSPALLGPLGALWVNPADHVFIGYGTLPASRLHRLAINHPPLPLGFTVALQTVLYDQSLQLSSATIVTTP